jgi:hypothetical protein
LIQKHKGALCRLRVGKKKYYGSFSSFGKTPASEKGDLEKPAAN